MKLILAVSQDGFLCMPGHDTMAWTHPVDKKIFRLLTRSSFAPLLAGQPTQDVMPVLPIPVQVISREGVTLGKAQELWPDAWLIGGPTLARAALDGKYVRKVYLVMSPICLYEGVPVSKVKDAIPGAARREVIKVNPVMVEIFSW